MGRPLLLVLASTYPARDDDGTPAFVRDLALGMLPDFDVHVVVPAVPGAPLTERVEVSGGVLTVERYRFFPRRWEDVAAGAILENLRSRPSRLLQVPCLLLAQRRAVQRAIRRLGPAAVHAHWIIPQGVVASALLRRGNHGRIPLLVTTLGGDLYALRGRLAARAKRRVVRSAAAVTVMNADMRDRVLALGAQDVRVMPMGARLSSLGRAPTSPRTGPPRVLAVGRLVSKKGFDVLIDAVAALAETDSAADVTVTIAGDGQERAALQRRADGLSVTFAGQLGRDALDRVYAEADIAVFPSRRAASGDQDGLPVAMLEAMGAGCAVVASDLPGLNEAIVNGVSGVLVPAGDAHALAMALASLIRDGQERERLGAAARARAAAYSIEAVSAGYRALLTEVISRA